MGKGGKITLIVVGSVVLVLAIVGIVFYSIYSSVSDYDSIMDDYNDAYEEAMDEYEDAMDDYDYYY